MDKSSSRFFGWYDRLFNFLAQNRREKRDLEFRWIHNGTVSVLSTGPLMWGYAIVALTSMTSPVPGIVGVVCSIIHTLSPLLYRISSNNYLISNIFIGAGFIHQATFGYYSGGFDSFCIKWFAILPILAGICAGSKGAITWFMITILANVGFITLHLMGHQFPMDLTDTGYLIGNSFILFGFIFLSTILFSIYDSLWIQTESVLKDQKKKIDDLFRVLFHDLANPLGRIDIGLSLAKKQTSDPATSRGIEIASEATETMLEITQNIRKMYAISKGEANVDLALTSLNEAMKYVKQIFEEELMKKEITVLYDTSKYQGLALLVEPISFKNQVLGNILSNAIKFSSPGSEVHIRAFPLDRNIFILEVQDFGVGIPSSILPHIFDFTKKISRKGTHGEMGTGFGMQIMKSFMEIYGGHVEVESQEKSSETTPGTTIRLKLRGEWLEPGPI